jgi:hypothetical protein
MMNTSACFLFADLVPTDECVELLAFVEYVDVDG